MLREHPTERTARTSSTDRTCSVVQEGGNSRSTAAPARAPVLQIKSNSDRRVMAGDEECSRPKRRRAAARATVPSAVHYLGYVEEDETPEAIMKKFEELEKVPAGLL